MKVIWFLIPLALGLGGFFAALFILSVKRGQLDDVETPATRILISDFETTERKEPFNDTAR